MNENQQPRVLFVTTSYPRSVDDYAGSFVHRFAKYTSRHKCRIEVIAPSDASHKLEAEIDGIRIHRFSYFFPANLQRLCYGQGGILANLRNSHLAKLQIIPFLIILFLQTYLRSRKADIIHCHWMPTVWVTYLATRLKRKKPKIVFTNWGSDTRHAPTWLVKLTLKLVSKCISTAEETDEHLRAAGYTGFVSVPAPIDEEKFSRRIDPITFRKSLSLPIGVPVISFVGRLNYFKDPKTFIRACEILMHKKIHIHALIAGEGDLADECYNLIQEKGLSGVITMLGPRNDCESIFQISSVTVHISPIENTWANTIAEAMFCGCPVIMTNVGQTNKTFTHEENCLICEPKAPEQLVDCIVRLIEDKELNQRLASGGKSLLEKHEKRSSTIGRKMSAIYYQLLQT